MTALFSKGVIDMAFRLPENLVEVKQQYQVVGSSSISALEESVPHSSRMLVGLTFAERYEGFEADCERANERLSQQEGLYPWPEYPAFVTPDPDGEPVAWITYQSSPAWFIPILVILGGFILLPIVSMLGFWITEKIWPGVGDLVSLAVLLGMGWLIYSIVKSPEAKEVAKEVIPTVVEKKRLK